MKKKFFFWTIQNHVPDAKIRLWVETYSKRLKMYSRRLSVQVYFRKVKLKLTNHCFQGCNFFFNICSRFHHVHTEINSCYRGLHIIMLGMVFKLMLARWRIQGPKAPVGHIATSKHQFEISSQSRISKYLRFCRFMEVQQIKSGF